MVIPGYAKFILALLICDMISSTMIKTYHLSNYTEHWRIVVAIAVYVMVPILLLLSLKYQGVGNMNFYWNVMSTVFVFLIAIYYFGEKVTNSQFIGIVLAIFGVFLVIHGSGSSEQ